MKEKKLRNFLVNVLTCEGLSLEKIDNFIVKATDEDDVRGIMEKEGISYENIFKIERLSGVKRINREELTVRKAMEMISDPAHFAEGVKLFESMMVAGKLNYKSLATVLSPYCEIIQEKKLVQSVKNNDTKWVLALEGPQDKAAFKIVFQYVPKNKRPFKSESQIYELWIEKSGDFKNLTKRITFKEVHNNGHQSQKHSIVEMFKEMRKIIPDLPARIEQCIIQAM